ncbi:MAG: TetR/AcrR family transcriptional regulator [Myxococcota bacterium]
MPSRTDARDKLIGAAIRLFRRRGYHAVGIAELLENSGAPRGSFYYHFPAGKEELAIAAVERAGAAIESLLESCFDASESLEVGAQKLAHAVAEHFETSGFEAGCPVMTVLLDTVPESSRLHQAGQLVLDRWLDVLERHAHRLGDQRDTKRLGLALFVALEGGWVVARVQRSVAPILLAGQAFAMASPDPSLGPSEA